MLRGENDDLPAKGQHPWLEHGRLNFRQERSGRGRRTVSLDVHKMFIYIHDIVQALTPAEVNEVDEDLEVSGHGGQEASHRVEVRSGRGRVSR